MEKSAPVEGAVALQNSVILSFLALTLNPSGSGT
jgi:hypothetical protein